MANVDDCKHPVKTTRAIRNVQPVREIANELRREGIDHDYKQYGSKQCRHAHSLCHILLVDVNETAVYGPFYVQYSNTPRAVCRNIVQASKGQGGRERWEGIVSNTEIVP